jgi:hypothetical protein
LIYVSPALPRLTAAVIGDGGDNYHFLGVQYLARRLITTDGFPLGRSDYWRYPNGVDFQSAADAMLFVAVGLVLYVFFADPILVYNLSVIVLVFLNLLVSYFAFRIWFGRGLALIGAIMYGLSFYSLAKLGGHINLIVTAGFPLFFCAACRIARDGGRARDFVFLGLAASLLTLSSLQYPLILLGAVPFFVLFLLVFQRASLMQFFRVIARRQALALLAVVLALAIVLPFEGRKITEFLRGDTILPAPQFIPVPPVNLVVPNSYVPSIVAAVPNGTRDWIEYALFIGYAEILCLFAAAFFLPRTRMAGVLWFSTAVLGVLTLGIWPYGLLFETLPYRGIIEPGRFYVVFYLGITILILMFLQQRVRDWRVLLAFGFVVAVERLPWDFQMSPTMKEADLVAAVQSKPTSGVLDLPVYLSWFRGQLYDAYSVHYERPIVMGYIHWSGDHPESRRLTDKLKKLQCYYEARDVIWEYTAAEAADLRADILSTLEKNDIRVVVVHKNLLRPPEQCGLAHRFIEALLEETERWEVLLDTDTKRVLWLRL